MTTVGVLYIAYLLLLAVAAAGFRAFSAHSLVPDEANTSARIWTNALTLQLLGWLALGLRWLYGQEWLEPLGCALFLAGYVEMLRAPVIEVGGCAPWRRLHLPSALILLAISACIALDLAPATRLMAFWLCVLMALLIALRPLMTLFRGDQWWPDRSMGVLFLLSVPLVLWRVFEQFMLPAGGPHLTEDISLAQSAVLVYFVLLPILANVGFIQMRHHRRTRHMRYLALHDQLTGLGNREAFQDFGARALSRAWREQSPLSLLMIDLDYFKQVNDRHGHAVGDVALQQVAKAISGAVRESDFAARMGGDEFAILLDGAGEAAALEIAQRIVVLLREFTRADEQLHELSLSIGIATQEGGRVESLDQLARDADRKLYAAKDAGRARIVSQEAGEVVFDAGTVPATG